jgi:CRP-like cAMP-binding protein
MEHTVKKALQMVFNRAYDGNNPVKSLAPLVSDFLVTVTKNKTIIFQEDVIEYFYILLSGKVSVVNSVSWGYDLVIDYLTPVHILGLVEYLNNIPTYTAFIVTETKCTFLKLPAEDFIRIIKEDSQLCYQTLVLLGEVTQANMNNCELKTMVHPKDILGNHLFHLASASALPYIFPTTRAELAQELRINLRTLYRYTKQLSEDGFLSLERGKIVVGTKEFEKMLGRYNELIL